MTDADRRYKILMVEDDKLDRMAFDRFIAQNDQLCVGRSAASLAEAEALLAERPFDVIITDYHLGDGTGLDVIALAKDTPVILATGGGNEEIASKALKAGASDYLVKDAEGGYLKLLMLTVVRAMSRKRAEREARLLAEAVRSITDAVFVTNSAGELVFVNAAFCQAFGHDAKDAPYMTAAALWAKGAPGAEGMPWKGEALLKRKDGGVFPVDYGRSILPGPDGRPAFSVHVVRDMTEKKKAEAEREGLIRQLQEALSQVKKLSGLLPTCAGCKKVRDERGDWTQIETYISQHSEAAFSHGVCPECVKRLYPEFAKDMAGGAPAPAAAPAE